MHNDAPWICRKRGEHDFPSDPVAPEAVGHPEEHGDAWECRDCGVVKIERPGSETVMLLPEMQPVKLVRTHRKVYAASVALALGVSLLIISGEYYGIVSGLWSSLLHLAGMAMLIMVPPLIYDACRDAGAASMIRAAATIFRQAGTPEDHQLAAELEEDARRMTEGRRRWRDKQ